MIRSKPYVPVEGAKYFPKPKMNQEGAKKSPNPNIGVCATLSQPRDQFPCERCGGNHC